MPRTHCHAPLARGVWRSGQARFSWTHPVSCNGAVTAPTGAQRVAKIVESGFHIKHGTIDIHLSHNSAIDGPRLTLTPGADIVMVFDQSLSYATARLVDPQSTFWPHRMEFLPTPLQQTAQWFLPDFRRTSWPSRNDLYTFLSINGYIDIWLFRKTTFTTNPCILQGGLFHQK